MPFYYRATSRPSSCSVWWHPWRWWWNWLSWRPGGASSPPKRPAFVSSSRRTSRRRSRRIRRSFKAAWRRAALIIKTARALPDFPFAVLLARGSGTPQGYILTDDITTTTFIYYITSTLSNAASTSHIRQMLRVRNPMFEISRSLENQCSESSDWSRIGQNFHEICSRRESRSSTDRAAPIVCSLADSPGLIGDDNDQKLSPRCASPRLLRKNGHFNQIHPRAHRVHVLSFQLVARSMHRMRRNRSPGEHQSWKARESWIRGYSPREQYRRFRFLARSWLFREVDYETDGPLGARHTLMLAKFTTRHSNATRNLPVARLGGGLRNLVNQIVVGELLHVG